jgi:undecaprenyl-diphosphatase
MSPERSRQSDVNEPPRRRARGRDGLPRRDRHAAAMTVKRLAALDDQLLRQVVRMRATPVTFGFRVLCRLLDPDNLCLLVCAILFTMEPVAIDIATHVFWALMSTTTVVVIVKRTVRRRRPSGEIQALEPPDPHSFPSGHTAAAFAIALAMFGAVPWLAPVLIVVAIVVGYARMYLGVHFPVDVLAGTFIGIFTGSIVALLPL